MMRRGLLALAVLASMIGGGVAQDAAKPPFKMSDYPAEVQEALKYGPEECKDQGGGEVTFAPDTVRKVDLNGDGRDDYVVSFQDAECSTYPGAFCGTAGCTMDFLVTLPNGKIRSVFAARIRGYEILPAGRRGRSVFNCTARTAAARAIPRASRSHRITGKPFEFKEPKG